MNSHEYGRCWSSELGLCDECSEQCTVCLCNIQDCKCTQSLPPHYDDAGKLLEHIADMMNCQGCFPNGYGNLWPDNEYGRHGMSGYCSKHRDPILLANGWVHGWTHKGGMPINMKGER